MADIEIKNRTRVKINLAAIEKYAEKILATDKKYAGCELSITFIGDRAMQGLNEQYRGKGQPTDVLSFSMMDDEDEMPGVALLGDVVIAPRQAMADAQEEKMSFEKKLKELTLHGILHLMGHDHETPSDAKKMERRREKILASLETRR